MSPRKKSDLLNEAARFAREDEHSPPSRDVTGESAVAAAAEKAHDLLQRLGPQFAGRVTVMVQLPCGLHRLTLKKVTEADAPIFVETAETQCIAW